MTATEPSPTSGRRPATQAERSSTARRTLIDATVSLLADEGYDAATVARIQEVSGLSRGLVGYHFGSKQKLMEAVVESIRVTYLETVDERRERGTGLERVREMFDSYLTRLLHDPRPAKAMLVLATESATEPPEVRRAVRQHFGGVRERFAVMLRAGIEDGSVRDSCVPEHHAGVLQGLLRGIVLQYLLDPEGFDLAGTKEAALASLRHDLSV